MKELVMIEVSKELKEALDAALLERQTYTELITEMMNELSEYLEDTENTQYTLDVET